MGASLGFVRPGSFQASQSSSVEPPSPPITLSEVPSENVAHDSAKAIVSAGRSIWASAAATTPEFLSGCSPRSIPSWVRKWLVMA